MKGRAGPVTKISVFLTTILVTGMQVFRDEHSSPLMGTKLFKIIASFSHIVAKTVCISTLGVCKIAFLVKLQEPTKLWQSRFKFTVCSTILVVFLEIIPDEWAEISHMNTPQNSSWLLGSYEEALTLHVLKNYEILTRHANKLHYLTVTIWWCTYNMLFTWVPFKIIYFCICIIL